MTMNMPLNDPDFDQPSGNKGGKSFFEALSPKSALTVGAIGGFMALCTVGFFVLLGLLIKGNVSLGKTGANPSVAALPTAAAPNDAPTEAPTGPVPPVTKSDHVRGSGAVTIIEYSDYECPFCKRFHPTMLQVMEKYSGKVRWVYRHYPLPFHANAQKEAEAAECAGSLGGDKAFWAYSDKIFERTTTNGTGFPLENLVPLAKELGLSESKFKACLDGGKFAQYVRDQMNAGAAAGISGTPGSFLIDKSDKAQLISGALPFESMAAAIESVLK